MKKRGVLELHFNWIFVLIAGAVIFAFFIAVVNKQREFSEIKSSGTIITNLDSILTGAQVSTKTVNIIDMPKVDIGFECNRYFIGSVPKQIKSNVVFAPGLLKGKRMITWTLDWNVPYRVTNFLYITDPQLRYVIVYDVATEDVANKLYDELPKEINKENILVTEIAADFKDKNNYKVKFVFLTDGDVTDAPSTDAFGKLSDMDDRDITAINVNVGSPDVIESTGEIMFYENDEGGWLGMGVKTFYLKHESLFGAVFAEDDVMYNCAMRKAFKKLNFVSEIYNGRSSSLKDYYGPLDNCYDPHSKDYLNEIVGYSDTQSTDFPENFIFGIEDIENSANSVEGENHKAQLNSCALIY